MDNQLRKGSSTVTRPSSKRRTKSAPARLASHASIQKKDENRSSIEPSFVLVAMRGQATVVAGHKHGVRLLQFVVENGNKHEITLLIDELFPVLGDLALNPEAQRFLECTIKSITSPYQARQFARALRARVFDMLESKPALRILELSVRRFASGEVAFIFQAAAHAAKLLLQSSEGLHLLQVCLSREHSPWRTQLWMAIMLHSESWLLGHPPVLQEWRQLASLHS
eukprot:TRINITY_DN8906_c0_g1_i1.p1 TRINITY_DN8906_c0_g1~~TRINITY_DN8906_c0_g1_i1.p1  ORF type:complete len:241 (-),score=42.91 TRINITY_DN8906_c0_g1_i1:142-816(-)